MDFSNGGSHGDKNDDNKNFTDQQSSLSRTKTQLDGYGSSSDENSSYEGSSDNEGSITTNILLSKNDEILENHRMWKAASTAMRELIGLMNTNEPLWAKSSSNDVVEFILVHEKYANMFPKVASMEIPKGIHIESSKYSKVLRIGGMQLVNMFLDSERWINTFPTIVFDAKTIKEFDVKNYAGAFKFPYALKLMDAQVHICLPLLPTIELSFLRYCEQIDVDTWVIVDVSPSPSGGLANIPRMYPSGCMIRQMSDGTSMVTWVEHVVVDDQTYKNKMYESYKSIAYGARKWLLELEKKCEKQISLFIHYVPRHAHDKEIVNVEGRKSVMNLSNQMVKRFCRTLSTDEGLLHTVKTNPPPLLLMRDGVIKLSGIDRMLLIVINSVRLHVSPHNLFHFLNDDNRRHEWDRFTNAKPVHEIAHISNCATDTCTHVSFIKTFNWRNNIILYLKESSIDALGAYIMYAPIHEASVTKVLSGDDISSTLPMIPSGFMISEASNVESGICSGGSLLTFVYQMFYPDLGRIPDNEDKRCMRHYVLSTIQKIRAAFES